MSDPDVEELRAILHRYFERVDGEWGCVHEWPPPEDCLYAEGPWDAGLAALDRIEVRLRVEGP